MSADNDGGAVGIGMVELESKQDPYYQLKEEQGAEGSSYKGRFKSILTDHYDDEKTWWGAVEDLLKKDTDFVEKVAAKLQAEGEKQREDAIVEVMVDLLLNVEGITVHKGLVYVLEEGLESYPLELMAAELLKRGADPNEEKGYSGSTPLHLAITEKKLDLVKTLLEKGARLEAEDDDGDTPFLKAVKYGVPEDIADFLLEHGANVRAVTEDRKTALHFAAQMGKENLMSSMIERGLSADVEDKDGWRPLHEAAHYGSKVAVVLLVENGALVNARCHRKRTPLHVAAEEGEEEIITVLLDKKADANVTDLDGNTPLDLAAKKQHKDALELILNHSFCPKKDGAVKKTLQNAMTRDDHNSPVRDDFVKEQIGELSPFSVVSMLKSKKCGGEGRYQFLEHFVKEPMLKKSTKAIMDHFVLGKKHGRVNCEIIEADVKGIPPDQVGFDESSQSLLDVIAEQNDKELAQHPSIKAILEYKWKKFARWLFFLSLTVYAVRMLFFGLALLIAARPELDNPGCYRDGWDYFRGICEGISVIFFVYKIADEIVEMCSLQKVYFKDYYNYLQWLAVILPLLIIPFRVATTWCASTGDGYCNDPTLLSPAANATNVTLHFNLDCITASHVQWIVASLAYMVNAILVVEYLALSRRMGVYVKIILGMIMKDIVKFTAIFIVGLYVFVGSFYLALRSGVTVQKSGDIVSDLEKFELQTLYPWHVVFTGFQILFHGGGILTRGYYAIDDDGQYTGYHWFSIVLYLAFLFFVTVVLLSVLIAQMNDTYKSIQDDVEGTFAVARARIITRLQKGNMWLLCMRKTYRKHFFQKEIWTDLTAEELKQEEQEENAEERVALMEQKTDWLKGSSGDIMRRLDMREDSAQEIKRLIEEKVEHLSERTARGMQRREESAQHIKSSMEQKVDHLTGMTAEVKTGLMSREDSAQQIKSGMEQKVNHLTEMTAEVTRGLVNREDSAQQIKSLLEQKVDQLNEMTAQGLQNREDSAQEIKSLLEQKVDRLAEMMDEVMRRLPGPPKDEEEGVPAPEGD